jgi:hypothetical protein
VALPFVLDVEGEDVVWQVFPLRGVGQQLVPVLQNMCETVVEIKDGRRVLVEPRYVVLCSGRIGTVDCREFVFADICVCGAVSDGIGVGSCTSLQATVAKKGAKVTYHFPSIRAGTGHALQ